MADHRQENKNSINTGMKDSRIVEGNPTDLITSDNNLRNLYQLGFNSKTLTKGFVNSFKFDAAIELIKNYIDTDELSIKSLGPLVLGLAKVYNKKVSILLDETQTIFTKPWSVLPEKEIKKEKRIKSKEVKSTEAEEELGKEKPTIIKETGSLQIVSQSPLNDTLFKMIDRPDETTERFLQQTTIKSEQKFFDLTKSTPIEAFRATGTRIAEQMTEEPGVLQVDRDFGNFFQFSTDRMEPSGLPTVERPMGFENYNLPEGFQDITGINQLPEEAGRRLSFTDVKSKLDLGVENLSHTMHAILRPKEEQPVKRVRMNQNLEYDENIEIEIEPEEVIAVEDTNQMLNRVLLKIFIIYNLS
jgi:hypothetical protein